jgi:hypothetical protein
LAELLEGRALSFIPGECIVIEEWKALDKTNDYYEVSNWGRIRRAVPGINAVVGQIMRQGTNGWGYAHANLKDGKGGRVSVCVHVCVARLFLGPKPAGYVVNHIDGDKKNNRADNLEYVTLSGNLRHAYKIGLRGPRNSGGMVGEDHPRAKLTADDVINIRHEYRLGDCTQKDLAERYGVAVGTISSILARRSWKRLSAKDAYTSKGTTKSVGPDVVIESREISRDIERAINAVLSASERCSKSSISRAAVQCLLDAVKSELEQAVSTLGETIEERMVQ